MTTLHGIIPNLPAAEYHAQSGASASILKKLWQTTPAHLKAYLAEPFTPTPAMQFGTWVHHVLLEPDTPLPSLAVTPTVYPAPKTCSAVKRGQAQPGDLIPWDGRATYCKDWKAEQEEAGRTVLDRDTYDGIFAAAGNVMAHPVAGPLFAEGQSELSLFATVNGFPIRARLDHVAPGDSLVDLKTAQSADPRRFPRDAYKLGYHIQAAFYLDLWNALAGVDDPKSGFTFVVVENTAPYAVCVYSATAQFIQAGREDYQRMLDLYRTCVETNTWPAYPVDTQALEVPKYAI